MAINPIRKLIEAIKTPKEYDLNKEKSIAAERNKAEKTESVRKGIITEKKIKSLFLCIV